MTHSRWLLLGCLAAVGGAWSCGDGPVATAGPTGGTGGTGGSTGSGGSGGGGVPAGAGVGDDCADTSECRAGLVCDPDSETCEPGHSLGQGEPCVIGPECEDGLQCLGGTCAPAGDGDVGDACTADGNCMSGLRCDLGPLGGACAVAGDGDVGDDCSSNLDCYAGLNCSTESGTCQPGTGAPGGLWTGVECDPISEDDPVRAYFEVPGAEDAEELDFFRLPFPNDVRIKDGSLDLSGFPTPGPGLIGVDVVQMYVDAIQANDSAFGAYGAVTFRFSGEVDTDTLRDENSVNWVDITPGAPEYGQSYGLTFLHSYGKTPYVCHHWLSVRPSLGGALEPGHTYAVWLSTGARTPDGDPIVRPQNLVSLLADSEPSDPALAEAYPAYQAFRDYMEDELIDPATVLNASVFTVAPIRDTMADIAAAIEDLDPPTATDWVKCDDDVTSPCDDGTEGRACGAGTADYDEYHALVSLPVFQQGTAPYLTSGGGISVSSDPERQDVCMSLTVPTGTMPAEGWPVVVFAHGTGGGFRSHVRPEVAGVLAAASPAFAVLGIDQVVHGPRRGSSTQSPDLLFFNVMNPAAARGNPMQGAADQLSLARFASTLDVSASETGGDDILLDPAKVFFFGHSQGSTEGSLALPFSDIYKAAVLSGNGASLMDALLTKTKPQDITALVPALLSDPSVEQVGATHPVLNLLQQWIDPADPLNYALPLTRKPIGSHPPKHAFQTFGMDDSYSPPVTMQTYALSGIIPQVGDVIEDLFLPEEDEPASGNVSVSGTDFTLGLKQYAPPDDSDGHFVVFDVAEANADMVRFFETAASDTGVPQIGE